jgi:hypothetical protein
MNEEKIKKIAVFALILSLLAVIASSETGLNFISGDNINISQAGNNITITGAATWTLTSLDIDSIKVGSISSNISSCPIGMSCIPEANYPILIELNYSYLNFLQDVYWHGIKFDLTEIINNINNVTEIQNNLTKYRQTAFEINLNSTYSVKSDLVLLPYDMVLKNISTQLDNNTGYFNYTVNKYSTYPTGKSELITINSSSYINVTSMNKYLNRHESVEIVYNNFSKVNTSIILFEFEYQ